ncbi:MAG: hypothetical protein JSW23_09610 [Planctomycetota bacterium]|nr:MAG: hypothetical protein JSW23_09610 [Planctomycetota bacterium]
MCLLTKKKVVCLSVLFVALFVVAVCSQVALAKKVQTAGNCLSMPVIFADGATKVLRGVYGSPVFLGAFDDPDGIPGSGDELYLQQDEQNMWQAASLTLTPGVDPVLNVDLIDWGDNLEAVDWSDRSKVRVEVVLWQNISAAPMDGFEMFWISGEGQTEMWGTNTVVYDSNAATVYSGCARMTIQKLTKDFQDPTLSLTWDAAAGEWIGDANPATFNGGVWEGGDGPGYYSAEINVSGKCIYGYNWDVRKTGEGPGSYRLTFSLDANNGPTLNTFFVEGITEIMLPAEEEATTEEEEPPTGGGVAAIDYANNLTYIDVHIVEKSGGGGGGGKPNF